jgi:hypothetical protein
MTRSLNGFTTRPWVDLIIIIIIIIIYDYDYYYDYYYDYDFDYDYYDYYKLAYSSLIIVSRRSS